MKTTIAIIIAGLLIGGAILFTGGNKNTLPKENKGNNIPNVSIVDGIQIIEIQAKGGYQPRISIARANIPTILRFKTKGTFDCSSSIRIPSLNISKVLPNSGTTDIDLGSPKNDPLQGSCGMGMYPFEIDFKE